MSKRFVKRFLQARFRDASGHPKGSFGDVVGLIMSRIFEGEPGQSKYAKERRAIKIGRCPRCYRVKPGFYFTTRCDGVTCVPGISYNASVMQRIKYGV
uniref:RNA silencing suppressor n=2 Tax=Butterbur mosaic virus TaxID=666859 RepID=A0A7U0MGH8_9VIRU|nr:NABP [Butterbur mosaic virus]QQX32744.1 nucleic acid binding protein [Butterbur mosaic virus]